MYLQLKKRNIIKISLLLYYMHSTSCNQGHDCIRFLAIVPIYEMNSEITERKINNEVVR